MSKQKRKQAQKIPIGKIILSTLAVGGLIAVAIAAPNAVQALRLFGYGKGRRDLGRQTNRSFYYLKEKGYIALEEKEGTKFVCLTEKGKKKLAQYQRHEISFKKPRQWDRKWRVVIFDIKEKRRSVRNKLRAELQNIGFVRLQNSVWVFPYDCEEMLVMLKADIRIGKDVLYLVSEHIENDAYLKKIFNLD